MKLRIWLLTKDRDTWVTGAEVFVLGVVLLGGSDSMRVIFGLPLLVHVGYRALTSLPLGRIPGRPEWSKQVRRNQELRTRVVGFLNEMRRVQEIAHRSRIGGRAAADAHKDLMFAKRRLMAAANDVVDAAGRPPDRPPAHDDRVSDPFTGITPRRA